MAYIGDMSKRPQAGPPVDANGRLKYAPTDAELRAMPNGEPPSDAELHGEPDDSDPIWTFNQLVAYNVQRARRSHGWSQEYLGRQLERYTGKRWTNAAVSAAERSWTTGRMKRFDANELVALSAIFKVPVDYFLLPPDEVDLQQLGLRTSTPGDSHPYDDGSYRPFSIRELLALLDATSWPNEYLDRLERAILDHVGQGELDDMVSPRDVAAASWRSLVLGALHTGVNSEDHPEVPEVSEEEMEEAAGHEIKVSEGDIRKVIAKAMESVFNDQIEVLVGKTVKSLKAGGMTFTGEDHWEDTEG